MVAGAASDLGEASRGLALHPSRNMPISTQERATAPPPPPPAPTAPRRATTRPARRRPRRCLSRLHLPDRSRIAGRRFDAVMEAQVKACQDAGPRLCQLIGSSRRAIRELHDGTSICARSRAGCGLHGPAGAQAQEAGGKIRRQTTSTEDLTRAIVDTEASLRAKTTLRDRLQRLLATRPGQLSDLLEVEREFARVQGEIDATRIEPRRDAHARFDMSELTMNTSPPPRRWPATPSSRWATLSPVPRPRGAAASPQSSPWSPWRCPWPCLALVVWAVLAIRRRRGGRFFAPREAKAAETPLRRRRLRQALQTRPGELRRPRRYLDRPCRVPNPPDWGTPRRAWILSHHPGGPLMASLNSFQMPQDAQRRRQDLRLFRPHRRREERPAATLAPALLAEGAAGEPAAPRGRPTVTKADIEAVAGWLDQQGQGRARDRLPPARVLMQDFTGVPAVVDLAAMRDAPCKRSAAIPRRSIRWCRSISSSTTR